MASGFLRNSSEIPQVFRLEKQPALPNDGELNRSYLCTTQGFHSFDNGAIHLALMKWFIGKVKGQLISKGLFDVIVWTKKPTKFF